MGEDSPSSLLTETQKGKGSMNVRTYRLTSASTTAAVGQASTTVIRKGTIVGIRASFRGQGGAADGFYGVEVALNNSAQSQAETTTQAVSEQIITRCFYSTDAGLASFDNSFVPAMLPIEQGNIICINLQQSGTAASSVLFGFDVIVKE